MITPADENGAQDTVALNAYINTLRTQRNQALDAVCEMNSIVAKLREEQAHLSAHIEMQAAEHKEAIAEKWTEISRLQAQLSTKEKDVENTAKLVPPDSFDSADLAPVPAEPAFSRFRPES